MKPIKIRRESDNVIQVIWDDNIAINYSLKNLRDGCPCAGCQGETLLFKTYKPVKSSIDLPGKYELKSIIPVGNYAIQIIWGDGHDTGIYSWEYLRNLSNESDCNGHECNEHGCDNHCKI